MKLSEMKSALAERDLTLTKSLGQNFLHDQNQIRRIVDAAEIAPSDKILEIGPGLGPLTELLVTRAGEVLAIEKDQRLFDFLQKKFSGVASLKLLRADALDYVKENRSWADWKLVANLPYSVASPIMIELAWADAPPKSLTATLQLEVVERIAAGAGDDHYGLMSLLVQLHYDARTWFKIPATCFFPAPDVDSACIILQRRTAAILPQHLHRNFMRVVKRGFSQRRKMMLKLLKQDWPPDALQAGFAAAGISPQARAEEVSLEKFARLTEAIST